MMKEEPLDAMCDLCPCEECLFCDCDDCPCELCQL